jgi:hypothetical protein
MDARATSTDEDLLEGIDDLNVAACRARRRMLSLLAEAERRELWREHGAHDMAHFVSMRYGVSWWKADRWMAAARALPRLPLICDALERGELSMDKVVELTRFATPESEVRLIRWASCVSAAAIRRRADLEVRRTREEAEQVEVDRFVRWWTFDEGRRFALEAELPAADGAVLARAIDRLTARTRPSHGSWDPATSPPAAPTRSSRWPRVRLSRIPTRRRRRS